MKVHERTSPPARIGTKTRWASTRLVGYFGLAAARRVFIGDVHGRLGCLGESLKDWGRISEPAAHEPAREPPGQNTRDAGPTGLTLVGAAIAISARQR